MNILYCVYSLSVHSYPMPQNIFTQFGRANVGMQLVDVGIDYNFVNLLNLLSLWYIFIPRFTVKSLTYARCSCDGCYVDDWSLQKHSIPQCLKNVDSFFMVCHPLDDHSSPICVSLHILDD